MNTAAVVKRILKQFHRDKRSVALMVAAPLLVLTLMWLVLDTETSAVKLAAVDVPAQVVESIETEGITVTVMDEAEAEEKLNEAEIGGVLQWEDGAPFVILEGSDPNTSGTIRSTLQKQLSEQNASMEWEYWNGSSELGLFDYVGPALIGFFVFFFVFIVGGVSFLRERTQGTLERLLASPVRRSEIVFGYLGGFGLFTVVQSIIIAAYSIYVLDVFMAGNFLYVLLVTILMALTALSLGTLVSTFAGNEFQMIQFIPLVIVPQVFFSGLFPTEGLAEWVQVVGNLMPLTYGAEALRDIMLRGSSFESFQVEVYILLGFTTLFTVLNIAALKKHRPL
ncbi:MULTISPECIES: ABC transporter permease [Halobacillus]|uniref:ABC transporter permease n=1 Tax=Halobacillus TaxID=45667 RepID=UPI001370AF8B|nr:MULTISPECIES: ABC transporter permease [Halobacillus]MYL30246.1 ABC transporter permease subunit [Halobacillus halophilus]MYL38237.1 ABC transporter permease subunit [Halobacillus litoralis]